MSSARTELSEFRPSLWGFGFVFFLERFVRFSLFMGVLWFDLVAILAMIWGANFRPDDRKLMLWMRGLMIWSVCITIADIYQVANAAEIKSIPPEQQVLGRWYLIVVLCAKLAWSAINLFSLLRDQRASQTPPMKLD
jgi:hypothetical protein